VTAAAVLAGAVSGDQDEVTSALLAAITPEFAEVTGFDLETRVVVFPQDHPTLGWLMCVVPGCGKNRTLATGLCACCHDRWKRKGRPPLEEYVAVPKQLERAVGVRRCEVPLCERPQKTRQSRLCLAHAVQRRNLRIPLEEFHTHPAVKPHPAVGPCLAASCTRERAGRGAYCLQHYCRWRKARNADPGLDEQWWQRAAPSLAEGNRISLRGLPLRVVAEFVYGLQERCAEGSKTRYYSLRPMPDHARLVGAGSLGDLDPKELGTDVRGLATELLRYVTRLTVTPESQRRQDRWDLVPFGYPGGIRFTGISQPWLREGAKAWALDNLPRRRGPGIAGSVQSNLDGIARLSESLRLQRPDHGDDLRALSREDITAFCNRLAYLQSRGEISGGARVRFCRDARRLLNRMRTLGLTRPGQPLHGLPDDFALTDGDLPDDPEDEEAGRDLPAEVIRQVCACLGQLVEVRCGPEVRTAIEMIIDTGRRPTEITSLPLDCLTADADGKPVLVYDDSKSHRPGRRLPIPAPTAGVIAAQQQRVRLRFPDTPMTELRLLPSPARNPHGKRPISSDWVSGRHRMFVDSLPEFLVPVLTEDGGQPVTRMLPFDKSRVFLYAYRHSYAQRHADAGVPPDVLRDLMDHKNIATTQRYCRVSETRRREAVDRVTVMQFDRHGNRIWRSARALLDSEHARRAVGEVSVPYGFCTEPGNVAAGGADCPVRYRCVGCGHFRTDVSYLPDLETYLADLLRSRERLLAAVDADDWARN
jgi:integrase